MSTLRCTPLHDDFGARVTGIELGEPISSVQIEGIRAAIDEYSLLVFPDQQMTDEAQLALTSQLGEPEAEHVTLGRTGETVHFGTVGNISADGSQHGNEAASTRYQKGNQLWHSDSSFREVPSYVTITHGYEVVGEGGETEFVSARAAYDRLDSADRDLVDPLEAVHDYLFSRSPVAPVHPAHVAPSDSSLYPAERSRSVTTSHTSSTLAFMSTSTTAPGPSAKFGGSLGPLAQVCA